MPSKKGVFMYMIQIEESKLDKISEYAEKMLKYGGKMMSCLEELSEESGMGHRGGSYGGRYGERQGMSGGSYGRRGSMGYKDDEDWDEYEEMGERRGGRRRDSRGRYM